VNSIASLLAISRKTVTRCCHRWNRTRINGLGDRPRSGRPALANARYIRLLLKTVRRSPRKHGYVFTVWSVGRLSAHMDKVTGIRIGPERLRQILRAHDIVYGRPRHTLHGKRNEREYRRAKKALQRLKRGPFRPMPNSSFGSPMKSSSTSCLT
jgi:transposase